MPTVQTSITDKHAASIIGYINYTYDDKDRLIRENDFRATNDGQNDYYYVGNNVGNAKLNAIDPTNPGQNNYFIDLADNLTMIRSSAQTYNDDNQTSMAGFTCDSDVSPTG